MTFEEFIELSNRNTLAFLAATELLVQNGCSFIKNATDRELVSALKESVQSAAPEAMHDEVVKAARALASLGTYRLLNYFRRSDFDFTQSDAPAHELCPVCGCSVEYEANVMFENNGYFQWYCSGCGAAGKEGYNKVFTQHYDVHDDEGNPFPPPAK